MGAEIEPGAPDNIRPARKGGLFLGVRDPELILAVIRGTMLVTLGCMTRKDEGPSLNPIGTTYGRKKAQIRKPSQRARPYEAGGRVPKHRCG